MGREIVSSTTFLRLQANRWPVPFLPSIHFVMPSIPSQPHAFAANRPTNVMPRFGRGHASKEQWSRPGPRDQTTPPVLGGCANAGQCGPLRHLRHSPITVAATQMNWVSLEGGGPSLLVACCRAPMITRQASFPITSHGRSAKPTTTRAVICSCAVDDYPNSWKENQIIWAWRR